MRSKNKFIFVFALFLCSLSLFVFLGCAETDSEQGSYSGSFINEELKMNFSMNLTLKNGRFNVSCSQSGGKAEKFTGTYTINEQGVITFDSTDNAFPFENTSRYNSRNRTVTVTHKYFGFTVVLKKR